MENFSKKTKRGRPRSFQRNTLEEMPTHYRKPGCLRSQMNEIFAGELRGAVERSEADIQRAILGFDGGFNEIASGRRRFPKGWRTVGVEAGRYITETGKGDLAVSIIADARRRGISFTKIASHFRALRIGDKEGNARSLRIALAQSLDRYCQQFPATTKEQQREAIEGLLHIINGNQAY